MEGKELKHWLLAIGFEKSKESKISKILCLDPSTEVLTGYFNAALHILNTRKGRYPYLWLDYGGENKAIQLNQAIALGNQIQE